MTLFAELKRRNVLRIAAAYVAVSWLLIQVVETLFPVFGLSDAAIRTVVIILAIGFIPALVVAWVFELTPEGIVKDNQVDHDAPAAKAKSKNLDRFILVALALAVGYFAVDKFVLDPARDQEREQAIAEAARDAGRTEAEEAQNDADSRPVLAVLPFAAVTATQDSEFFAAGVHDDLLTKLAQLPSMLVISRTSVLEYKNIERNIRLIGKELGATAILEGGVQSAGNRIRINAQLIDAKTDEHLWAETFDRELSAMSIFDVQDDIARAIADALHITFSSPTAATSAPTNNLAAYRTFHEAIQLRETRPSGHHDPDYHALLLKANELDPNFTRPLAEYIGGKAITVFSESDPDVLASVVNDLDNILEKIASVAPGSVDHLLGQAFYTYYIIKDYDLAHELVSAALERAPSDMRLMMIRSWIERRQGDFEAMLKTRLMMRKVDPRNKSTTGGIAGILVTLHRYDEAASEIEKHGTHSLHASFYEIWLKLREHRDFSRYAAELHALHTDNEVAPDRDLWIAYLAARDFDAASELIDQFEIQDEWHPQFHTILSGKALGNMLTLHAQGRIEELEQLTPRLRSIVFENSTEEERVSSQIPIALGFIAAVEGNYDEAVHQVRRWYRGKGQDWAERSGTHDMICQILGLSGAADEAVTCIRLGLQEPSIIAPFLEPYLPFYDPIREEPVFKELVAELEAG